MQRSGSSVPVHTDMSVGITEQCMKEDRRRTLKEPAEHKTISGSTVLRILQQNLKMRKIAAKWVPHHLNEALQ